jgi:hypothetical protein
MPVISWLLQPVMTTSAAITAWFVATDSANFEIVQMAVSVLLIAGGVAVLTFWPTIASWKRIMRIK